MIGRLFLAAWMLGLAACGDDPLAVQIASAAIVDGEPTNDFESVVAIALRRTSCDDPPSVLCSGTVIAERAVLSAAHCFLPMRPGLAYEVFAGDARGLGEQAIVVSSVVTHPGFDEASREDDVAVLWLARPIEGIAPQELPATATPAPEVGEPVELVGFGATSPGMVPDGSKRIGMGRIGSANESVVSVDPEPSVSCVGDSGGPLFTMGDAPRFVALASSGDPGCREDSVYALIAPSVQTFIEPTLEEGPPSEVVDMEVCAPSIEGPGEGGGGRGCGVVHGAPNGNGAAWLGWLALAAIARLRWRRSWR